MEHFNELMAAESFSGLMTTVLGIVIGFSFVLIGEALITEFWKYIYINRAMDNIDAELREIRDVGKNKDRQDENVMDYITFTPIWDSLIDSGDILIMKKKKPEYYKKVIKVYRVLNSIRLMYEADRTGLKKEIDESIEKVCEMIEVK